MLEQGYETRMRVLVKENKLEDTLSDLNHSGYTVVKACYEGNQLILIAQRINLKTLHRFNEDIIPEDQAVEIFNKKGVRNLNTMYSPISSIWNGLRMKWLNF